MTAPFSSSTPFSMANTAALQASGSELNGWLAASGLVQTADSGQVNWATVALPAASTLIGYEIWRFADSSIYFKLEWVTNTAATNCPLFFITVGTGSNGAGSITGQSTPRTNLVATNSTIASTVTSFPTLICRTADFFGICYKVGGSNNTPSILAFAIEKTNDSSGATTTTGFCLSYMGTTAAGIQNKLAVRTAAPAQTFAVSQSFCAVPGNVTSSINAAGNKQVYAHQFPMPDVMVSNFLCSYVKSEAAFTTTISGLQLVGIAGHTYIALENAMGCGNSAVAAATWGVLMRWEA